MGWKRSTPWAQIIGVDMLFVEVVEATAATVTVLVETTSTREFSCTARMCRDRFVEVTGLNTGRDSLNLYWLSLLSASLLALDAVTIVVWCVNRPSYMTRIVVRRNVMEECMRMWMRIFVCGMWNDWLYLPTAFVDFRLKELASIGGE
jgi:hypothetical protein